MKNKIILVGNPNTGKTTLFNSLTGKKEKTANYSGVTVKEKEQNINLNNKEYSIVDLPGLYSFYNETSEDELNASRYIERNKDSVFCFVMTDLTIKKNIYLLSELSKRVNKIVIFINQMQKKKQKSLEIEKIEKQLGITIIYESAKKVNSCVVETFYNCKNVTKELNYDELIKQFNLPQIKPQKIDVFLLDRVWGKLFAFFVFGFIVWFSYFSVGNYIGRSLFGWITANGTKLLNVLKINGWLASLINSVFFISCGAVVSFLPQLVFLLFFMYLFEEIGYLPRIAYLFNTNLEKINLNGKAVFSLVVGVGCTTSGYLTTKNIPNTTRKNCAKFLPFVGCSAKFPILLFLVGYVSYFVGTIYAFIVFIFLLFCGVLHLKSQDHQTDDDFIIELPRLKVPRIKECITKCFTLSIEFLKRVLSAVLIAGLIVWILKNFTINFKFEENSEKSIINFLAGFINVLFRPVGLDDNNIVVALMTGLVAKENIIGSLAIMGGFSDIGYIKIISFMLFVCFYTPCFSALKSAKMEFGLIFAVKTFLFHMCIAYLYSFIFYTFATICNIFVGFILCFITAVLFYKLVSVLNFDTKNKEDCKTCLKGCIKKV